MKPRTILLLVLMIFACVLGYVLGNFGAGVTLPVNGQSVTFKAFIPPISLPAELLVQPAIDIGGMQIGLYNTLLTTLIIDIVIIALALLGRRGLGDRPKNWFANAWEGYVEVLYRDYLVPFLGARAAVVVPIAVTVFTFSMIAGLFEMLPGHESIGVVQPVAAGGFCSVNVGGVTWITGVQVKTSVAQDCGAPAAGSAQPSAAGGVIVTPFLRLPTSDLSATLALVLIAFFFIEIQGVRANGWGHFRNFFQLSALRHAGAGMAGLINYTQLGAGAVRFLSKYVRIILFSFRIFGNMLVGSILLIVTAFILPMVLPSWFLALEFVIAIVQAFVFIMLIVVFTSLAVAQTDY